MTTLRAGLRRLRSRLPAGVAGSAVNLTRLARVVFSPDTLHTRDLARLHETDLLAREARVFSQNGEDGVVLHLLSRIGVASHRAVEIGAGGWSSNIANLVVNFGFEGVFIDGSSDALLEQRRRLEAKGQEVAERCRFVE